MGDSRGGQGFLCGCSWCIVCGFLGSRLFVGVGEEGFLLLGSGLRGFLLWWVHCSVCSWFVFVGLLWCWVFLVFVLFGLCVLLVCRGSVFGCWFLLLLVFVCIVVWMVACWDFRIGLGCVLVVLFLF